MEVGLKRNCADKYYTKEETTKLFLNKFINQIDVGENDIIIEPSAGSDVFLFLLSIRA